MFCQKTCMTAVDLERCFAYSGPLNQKGGCFAMSIHGKVPMFKMKANRGSLIAAVVVLLLGVAFFFEGHRDPGNIPLQRHADLVFAISVVIAGLLIIVATGRMWFGHLWHDRYK
jgi:multisubunit Na+/H+ antiporter MnhB subunit